VRPAFVAAATVTVLLSMSIEALAQTMDTPLPRLSAGPYVGVARHSLVGSHLGVTPDRDHLFLGVHGTWNVWRTGRWAVGYAPEVVPLLLISNNPTYETVTLPGGERRMFEVGTGVVAGFAISPIGVEGQVRLATRWRVYGAGAAGGVWFTRDVPVAYSRQFNYTFEVGGGALWNVRPRESLRFGYKFHHLSNAYTALQNPGIDGAVLLFGFEHAFCADRDAVHP